MLSPTISAIIRHELLTARSQASLALGGMTLQVAAQLSQQSDGAAQAPIGDAED